jgi:hypothetical protein
VWVVVDRGLHEAVADEAEDDHPCEVPEDADRGEGARTIPVFPQGMAPDDYRWMRELVAREII